LFDTQRKETTASKAGAATDHFVHGPAGVHSQRDSANAVLETRAYDPYGQPLASTGTPQPALERAKRNAFERKQHPNRYDFARVQLGQRLFVLRSQPVIHQTKQMHYNVFCSHDAASLGFDTQSVACARDTFNFSCFLSRTTGHIGPNPY
jgi:hypothetical protein